MNKFKNQETYSCIRSWRIMRNKLRARIIMNVMMLMTTTMMMMIIVSNSKAIEEASHCLNRSPKKSENVAVSHWHVIR